MDEFQIIKQYFSHGTDSSHIPVSVGDDCAVINVPAGSQLVFSLDTLVAGVHFLADADPAEIASRALRVNLSDLAAMGADPLCFTLGLTLPDFDADWLEGFSKGLRETAEEFECPLVGGDTTRGPLTISIQAQGTAPTGGALLRRGAQVGDLVCISGPLGDGAAALATLSGELPVDAEDLAYLNDRFYRPMPQLSLGKKLRGIAAAAIDVSDGLLADLGHICQSSGVGADIDIDRIPVSSAVLKNSPQEQWLPWVLGGGDDYQLCFTVPEEKTQALYGLMGADEFDISIIGTIVEGEGIRSRHDGALLAASGYQHFSTRKTSS